MLVSWLDSGLGLGLGLMVEVVMVMGQGKVMTAVTIALTYAYTWTISAQNTNLQPINDLVEVFGLCLERGLGVELLGDRRVGLGVDLRLLELFGHVESGN